MRFSARSRLAGPGDVLKGRDLFVVDLFLRRADFSILAHFEGRGMLLKIYRDVTASSRKVSEKNDSTESPHWWRVSGKDASMGVEYRRREREVLDASQKEVSPGLIDEKSMLENYILFRCCCPWSSPWFFPPVAANSGMAGRTTSWPYPSRKNISSSAPPQQPRGPSEEHTETDKN